MDPGKRVIKMWGSGSTWKNKIKTRALLTLSADISQCIKNLQTLSTLEESAGQDFLGLQNISNSEAKVLMPFDTG